MINFSLRDKHAAENIKALEYLRSTGKYTEEELQDLYDRQIKKDEESTNE